MSRAREEKKHAERKLRRKVDDFKYFLRHLDPPINIDDKWEDVKKRCLGPEYDALDEEKRVEAFDRVIVRLQVFHY